MYFLIRRLIRMWRGRAKAQAQPTVVAAYSVVGKHQQGTLDPVLTTPVRREEFMLGKALAALIPSLAISYGVYLFVRPCRNGRIPRSARPRGMPATRQA